MENWKIGKLEFCRIIDLTISSCDQGVCPREHSGCPGFDAKQEYADISAML